mgnify:CR=1 FL=1
MQSDVEAEEVFYDAEGNEVANITAAAGEYVAFVDSDDFVNLDMYERLYERKQNSIFCKT